jgi:hypothetical protein
MRILLAGAAFAASAASAWTADVPPSVQQGWYEDGRWSVAGAAFADGNKACVLANTQPTARGETGFVLNDFAGGKTIIMFRDTTIIWDASAGSVTFQIDDNPSFTARTETDTKRNLLIVPLANTPGSVMTALLDQLASGQQLHVVTSVDKLMFNLSGSSPAFDAFGRCIAAMSSDGY